MYDISWCYLSAEDKIAFSFETFRGNCYLERVANIPIIRYNEKQMKIIINKLKLIIMLGMQYQKNRYCFLVYGL